MNTKTEHVPHSNSNAQIYRIQSISTHKVAEVIKWYVIRESTQTHTHTHNGAYVQVRQVELEWGTFIEIMKLMLMSQDHFHFNIKYSIVVVGGVCFFFSLANCIDLSVQCICVHQHVLCDFFHLSSKYCIFDQRLFCVYMLTIYSLSIDFSYIIYEKRNAINYTGLVNAVHYRRNENAIDTDALVNLLQRLRANFSYIFTRLCMLNNVNTSASLTLAAKHQVQYFLSVSTSISTFSSECNKNGNKIHFQLQQAAKCRLLWKLVQ